MRIQINRYAYSLHRKTLPLEGPTKLTKRLEDNMANTLPEDNEFVYFRGERWTKIMMEAIAGHCRWVYDDPDY